ncbi:hypothetical protein Tco_0502678 [Tanacetum coccineum]
MYLSQRHRQGSRRLLEDILVSWDGYQLDSDSDVEEDQRTSNKFMADLNAEYHERALLENQKRFYKRSGRVGSARKPLDKSKETCFAWKSSMMKGAPRSGHLWQLQRMSLQLERMMQDQANRTSLHKSELSNLKNTVSINFSLQNEVIKVNLENESMKDEIIDLKKGVGRRKEKISSKEVVFTKADESSSMFAPEITSNSESECDSQESLPPLPKLIGAAPSGTSESLISLSNLTLNMADLTLDTPIPKKTRPSVKVSPTYVIKNNTEK